MILLDEHEENFRWDIKPISYVFKLIKYLYKYVCMKEYIYIFIAIKFRKKKLENRNARLTIQQRKKQKCIFCIERENHTSCSYCVIEIYYGKSALIYHVYTIVQMCLISLNKNTHLKGY